MTVAALFASHTPLKEYCEPATGVRSAVDACLAARRVWVETFQPDLVIAVGPDHFNGFFYRMMPSFCIGAAANSIGDWNTPPGPLPVSAEQAEACVTQVLADGVDVAVSYQMEVDHGITQLLTQVFEWSALPALLPVFINCAAPPRPTLQRVVAFGEALGRFAANLPLRVLITASGGISHDPPIPTLADAPPPVRERLIAGGSLSAEARAARQERVLNDALAQTSGISPRTPLNPDWDRRFLDRLRAFDFAAIATMDDASITRDGGCGGHEIRTWVAVAAAVRAAGMSKLDLHYYRAIPEWVAGYGVMTAGGIATV